MELNQMICSVWAHSPIGPFPGRNDFADQLKRSEEEALRRAAEEHQEPEEERRGRTDPRNSQPVIRAPAETPHPNLIRSNRHFSRFCGFDNSNVNGFFGLKY